MKLQPDKFDVQAITGYGPGWVGVGDRQDHPQRHPGLPRRAPRLEPGPVRGPGGRRTSPGWPSWGPRSSSSAAATRIRFPRPAWLRPLVDRGIGLETMDTAAACRTYNILAQEGRHVAVALLLEQPG